MVKRKEKNIEKKNRKRQSYDEWLRKKKSKENQRKKQIRSLVMREKRVFREWASMDLTTHKTLCH